MILKLQLIKKENIAEKLKAALKSSRSSGQITIDMVNFVADFVTFVFSLAGNDLSHPIAQKLGSLAEFIKFTAKRCIEHEKMKDLFTLVEDVVYNAAYLSILCWETYDEYVTRVSKFPSWEKGMANGPDYEPKLSGLMERINPIRPEVRQLYNCLLKASYSPGLIHSRMYLFDCLVKYNLEELLSLNASSKVAFSGRLQWLRDGTDVLFNIQSGPLTKTRPFLNLLVDTLEIETAIAVYSLYDVDLENTTEDDCKLLLLQLKFNHLNLELSLCQALRLNKTLIGYFQEDLTFISTFFKDSFEQCKGLTHVTDVLTLLQSAITEAGLLINSFSHDIEELWEEDTIVEAGSLLNFVSHEIEESSAAKGELVGLFNIFHFQWHLINKFHKAAIRQKCPVISASSTPKHPMVNLLNILPTNFEVLGSYFTILKSSKIPSSRCNLTMDELFMGLHEHILENLLLKDESCLQFTVTDKGKMFYHGLLVLVTFLADPPIQYNKCKNKNDLLADIGTVAIEAEAAIRSSYADGLDIIKSGKVSLLLQVLSVAFKLIKCEEKLTGLLKHKATLEAEFLDLVENAHEELIFLRAFLMDLIRQHNKLDILGDLLPLAEVAAHKATLFSSCESFMDRSSTAEMNRSLANFLWEIKPVNEEVRELCFSFLDESARNISVTDLKGFIGILFDELNSLLHNADVISFARNKIPPVQEKLKCLKDSLAHNIQNRYGMDRLEDLMGGAQTVANAVDLMGRAQTVANAVDLMGHAQTVTNRESCAIFLRYPDVISFERNKIPAVQEKLKCLKDSLAHNIQNRYGMGSKLEDLMGRVQTVANTEKYAIFFNVSGDSRAWVHLLYLSDVKQVLNFVEAEVKTIISNFPKLTVPSFLETNYPKVERFELRAFNELVQTAIFQRPRTFRDDEDLYYRP